MERLSGPLRFRAKVIYQLPIVGGKGGEFHPSLAVLLVFLDKDSAASEGYADAFVVEDADHLCQAGAFFPDDDVPLADPVVDSEVPGVVEASEVPDVSVEPSDVDVSEVSEVSEDDVPADSEVSVASGLSGS